MKTMTKRHYTRKAPKQGSSKDNGSTVSEAKPNTEAQEPSPENRSQMVVQTLDYLKNEVLTSRPDLGKILAEAIAIASAPRKERKTDKTLRHPPD